VDYDLNEGQRPANYLIEISSGEVTGLVTACLAGYKWSEEVLP